MLKYLIRQFLILLCTFTVVYTAFAEKRSYVLATASTGGTYYPVGVAIATLAKVRLEPEKYYGKMTLAAITSGGSSENIKLLRDGEAQFAILQGLYGQWAANGTGKLARAGKQTYLRSITMLWQNVEHMVIDSHYVKTGTVEDLKELYGQKFGIGEQNSGTRGSGEEILGNLGIDFAQYDYFYQGYGGTSSALQNGEIAGMNIPAGPPVGAITAAYKALGDGVTTLDFTDEQLKQVNKHGPLWTRFIIPAGTYPGQDTPIKTIAQSNFLAVHKDLPDEDVYQLTKTVYENLGFLNAIHKATEAMSISKAIDGLPVPLHPGALRYYREYNESRAKQTGKIIEIPAHLIPR